MENVIWRPQERQALFMQRPEDEVLYGGAAGGGKSDALVIEAARQVEIPYYKGLILRKTYPQLTELIEKSLRYYPGAFPRARYNEQKHCWTFPSGARIVFGSLQHEKDRFNYQGKAFDFIAFDELTHFTFDEYIYLKSRNRPNGPGTRVYMRSTANPGGVGHAWVKERFITAGEPMQTIWEDVVLVGPDGRTQRERMSRAFVSLTTRSCWKTTPSIWRGWQVFRKRRSGRCSTETGTATRDSSLRISASSRICARPMPQEWICPGRSSKNSGAGAM